MRSYTIAGRILITSAVFMVLAGCSGNNSQVAPTPQGRIIGTGTQSVQLRSVQDRRNEILAMQRVASYRHPVATQRFLSRDALGKPLTFISLNDFRTGNAYVDIYQKIAKTLTGQDQKMIGQITFPTGGVGGVATDSAGNLYVTTGTSIAIYAPPYSGAPVLTLDDSDGFPGGVAVSSQGVVAVANFCNAPGCDYNSGSVTFYAKNSIKSCATVYTPVVLSEAHDAFDEKGNLYVDGYNGLSSGPKIGEISGGCSATKLTLLTTSNTLFGLAGSVQVGKHDRFSILYGGGAGINVDTYNAQVNGSFGSPLSSTPLELNRIPFPIAFVFSASTNEIYAAEQGGGGILGKYDYPVGIAPENQAIVGNSPSDVAVFPPLIP